MSNLAVGDAICNMLMIECVLKDKDYSVEMFHNLYSDYHSQTLKAVVKDRSQFLTTWDETRLTQPSTLQDTIDHCCQTKAKEEARCFIRPSGTEDILRIYIEAKTKLTVDMIAKEILKTIEDKYVDYVKASEQKKGGRITTNSISNK